MDKNDVLLILFIVIMSFVCLGIIIMAINQVLGGIKERSESKVLENQSYSLHVHGLENAQPVVVETPAVQPAPVAQPTPVVEEVKDQEVSNAKEVVLNNTRETLNEEYAKLSTKDKALFDRLVANISELEKVRVISSKYKITGMQGQDKIAVLEIVRGEIRLNCFLVDSDIKAYGKESGNKIGSTKVKMKFSDSRDYEAAHFTLGVANKKALEARGITPTK